MRNGLILLAAAVSVAACDPGGSRSPVNVTAEETVTATGQTATPGPAVHPSPPDPSLRELPPPTGGVPVALGSPRAPELTEAEHRALVRSKLAAKPAARAVGTPPPVSAGYIAKQQQYLEKWKEMRPSIAELSPEEQNRRRAALKRSLLGD
jgi:hypothetical protein